VVLGIPKVIVVHKINKSHVKLPKFQKREDIDIFLRSFEKIAALHKWEVNNSSYNPINRQRVRNICEAQ